MNNNLIDEKLGVLERHYILNSSEETKERLKKEFEELYKANDTILGTLTNLFELFTTKDEDKTVLLITIFYEDQFIWNTNLVLSRDIVTKEKVRNLKLEGKNSRGFVYRHIIKRFPDFKNESIVRINNNVLKNNPDITLPYFLIDRGFLFPNISCDKNYEFEEGRKIYLDVGAENFNSMFYKIISLYAKLREEIDGHSASSLHNSKISHFKMRLGYSNDAVVFRLTKEEQYMKFIELLCQDKELLNSLNFTNPFVPSEEINGHTIGVIPNDDESYNSYVSYIVYNYLIQCVNKQVVPNLNDFMKYIESDYGVNPINQSDIRYQKGYSKILIKQVDKEMTR